MLAQHGWKTTPSPRRGFTVVEASRSVAQSPVVVVLHSSDHALALFRSALDESMTRLRPLVVLDCGDIPLRDQLASGRTDEIDPHEQAALRGLSANPHVSVVRTEPVDAELAAIVSYCETVEASLLIVAGDHIAVSTLDSRLSGRLFNADFDLLVVTDPQTHT